MQTSDTSAARASGASDGVHGRPSATALWVTGIPLLALAALQTLLVVGAPIDSVQGVIQKILYVHPACAFAAYAGFAVTAVCGALYLWKHEERFDRVAAAGAEVGVVFCTLVIVTGPIWGKGTWGHWWTWDPRLTVTLLLWFVYLAYLLLRSFTEGSERTARFAAVYGIAGLAVIPLNYFAIDLFGGAALHPENLQRDSLGAGMRLPFAVSVLTALAALAHLVVLRVQVASLRTGLESPAEREALGGTSAWAGAGTKGTGGATPAGATKGTRSSRL